MKTNLFTLLLCLAFTFSFAQFPFTGLEAAYTFDNGAVLVNGANNQNFTQTGTALTEINDRFNMAPVSAIALNGDYLTRPNLNFLDEKVTYSFWIKTSTNTSTEKTIIDDSERTAAGFNTGYGYYVYLESGQIGVKSRVQYQSSGGFRQDLTATSVATRNISDNEWHHVAIQIYTVTGQLSNGPIIQLISKVFIDGDDFVNTLNPPSRADTYTMPRTPFNNGNIIISNNRGTNLPTMNYYSDAIDDVLIYSRLLTASEIQTIITFNNYCTTPLASDMRISSVTQSTAIVSYPIPGTFDVAYHKSSESFSNAIILSGLTTGSTRLSGLDPAIDYHVYIREQCTNTTAWSQSKTFKTNRPIGRIYVNKNATGLNNGVSWANAYNELRDALPNAQSGEEVWVAKGTYTPDVSDRNISFVINQNDVDIYGGFVGNETSLSQRDSRDNVTILSGDLDGNDDNTIDYINTLKDDNSYTVLLLDSHNSIVDGFTITAGFSNVNESSRRGYGAGVYFINGTGTITIKNVIFKENIAFVVGAGIFGLYDNNVFTNEFNIESCEFINNLSRGGSGIYFYAAAFNSGVFRIENSLFNGNISKDESVNKGSCGSSAWLRANGTNSLMTTSIINSTFVNNIDLGTQNGLNNFNRATLGLSRTTANTHNASVSNSIFYDNEIANGVTARSISGLIENIAIVTVNNSIDEQNFSIISSGSKTNTSNNNPLFVDPANNNYTLMATSPAVDSGDNSFSTMGTTDLFGKARIFNNTIDIGAYEYDPAFTLSVYKPSIISDVILFPNPTSDYLTISGVENINKLQVFSIFGNKVLETTSKIIDVSKLSKGVYLLEVETDSLSIITKKFIKN